jgi:SRSO17 transposase
MAKRRRRPEKFSIVKAVKSNARDRVGQPRPARVIDDQKRDRGRKPKHRQTMPQLLSGNRGDE